jgi:hypothetical protein
MGVFYSKYRPLFAGFVIVACGHSGLAAGAAALQSPSLRVRVQNYAGVSQEILERAESVAAGIFLHAGIEVEWLDCPLYPGHGVYESGCAQGTWPLLRIQAQVLDAPAARDARCFGLAAMEDRSRRANIAIVFYNRIANLTWQVLWPSSQGVFALKYPAAYYNAVLLGHVMAHELGHLLLGPDSHTSNGIMSPHWNGNQLQEVVRTNLRFEPEQAWQLRHKAARYHYPLD